MQRRLLHFLIALWWGSLTALGAVFVPAVFATSVPKAVAGQMAGALFHAQFYLSMGCLVLLIACWLLTSRSSTQTHSAWQAYLRLGVATGCAALVEWVVAPHIVSRQDPVFWHGWGSGLFFLQWVIATGMLWTSTDHVFVRG
jgi:Mn2+/Fe2+ NRAMP family transporter